jgi:hypothetical protein
VGGDPSTFFGPVANSDTGFPFTGTSVPPSYALVGGAYVLLDGTKGSFAPAAEANSGVGPTGSKRGGSRWGTLRRGDRYEYRPATATTIQPNNPDMNAVAYQASTPWPFTGAGSTADQQAAFRDISVAVLADAAPDGNYPNGSCTRAATPIVAATANLRQLYCDEVKVGSLQSDINDATQPANATYSAATFTQVRDGLATEAGWVVDVFQLAELLADAYYDSSNNSATIADVVSTVQNAVSPPDSGAVAGSWISIMADALNLASAVGYFANEEEAGIAATINLLSAIGYVSNDGLSSFNFSLDAKDLGSEAEARATAMAAAIQTLPAIYATDYGKLSAVQGIGFSNNATNVRATMVSFARWATEQLVPLVTTVRWVNGFNLNQQTTPFDCEVVTPFFGKQKFFQNQDNRATFAVSQRMYLARDGGQGSGEFPNDSGDVEGADLPLPASDALLDFLFNPFTIDQSENVSAFGFPKQNFLWRIARAPWDCEQ